MWAKQTKIFYSRPKQAGFTIVELLIVIVVIGILAAITIVAFNGVQDRSRTARTQSDVRNLLQAVQAARTNTGMTLLQITGSTNSTLTKTLSDAAIDKIMLASDLNISKLKDGDGWGNYYRIDENEKELSGTDCRKDSITVLNRPELSVAVPSSQSPC